MILQAEYSSFNCFSLVIKAFILKLVGDFWHDSPGRIFFLQLSFILKLVGDFCHDSPGRIFFLQLFFIGYKGFHSKTSGWLLTWFSRQNILPSTGFSLVIKTFILKLVGYFWMILQAEYSSFNCFSLVKKAFFLKLVGDFWHDSPGRNFFLQLFLIGYKDFYSLVSGWLCTALLFKLINTKKRAPPPPPPHRNFAESLTKKSSPKKIYVSVIWIRAAHMMSSPYHLVNTLRKITPENKT